MTRRRKIAWALGILLVVILLFAVVVGGFLWPRPQFQKGPWTRPAAEAGPEGEAKSLPPAVREPDA